jgi:hypothetical protein
MALKSGMKSFSRLLKRYCPADVAAQSIRNQG